MLKRVADDFGDPVSATPRNNGLDVLRGCIALLVVAHHTAITYGGSGDWFYREVPSSGSASSLALSLFCGFNQAWFMGLFFLLAGVFTPASITRHGAVEFARERLVKLGLPVLVFGYVLGPVTSALARTTRGQAFAPTLLSMWERATFILGPPWFCWALLLLSACFLLLRARFGNSAAKNLPSNGSLLLAAIATGLAAFALRLVWPVGTSVLGLQLGYFASYILLFAAGCASGASHTIATVPRHRTRLWGVVALVTFPVLPIAAILSSRFPGLSGSFDGGWNIPALVYALWEPFVAWGVILGLLAFFQRRFVEPGLFARALGRRAYAIFIIHPPIVVAMSLLIRTYDAPPLAKFAVAAALSCMACFVLAGLVLRVPGVARVL